MGTPFHFPERLSDGAGAGRVLKEELARLQGVASGKYACKPIGRALKAVRADLEMLREDLRGAAAMDGSVTVSMSATRSGFAMTVGGAPAGGMVGMHVAGMAGPAGGVAIEVHEEAVAAPGVAIAMSTRDFRQLLAAVGKEDFSSGKLRVLSDGADYRWFSSAQVKQMLAQFDFGSDQLKGLKLMAPRIADPEQSYTVYDAFDFDSDKKKAKKILHEALP